MANSQNGDYKKLEKQCIYGNLNNVQLKFHNGNRHSYIKRRQNATNNH